MYDNKWTCISDVIVTIKSIARRARYSTAIGPVLPARRRATICKTILLIHHGRRTRGGRCSRGPRLTEQCFSSGETYCARSREMNRRARTKNDNRELCGTLRRNVKATRRSERKSFLVIHPSARGLPGRKKGPVNCGSAISAKATLSLPASDPRADVSIRGTDAWRIIRAFFRDDSRARGRGPCIYTGKIRRWEQRMDLESL